jgi:glycosyltransferase involved in cell wall biosynthesis
MKNNKLCLVMIVRDEEDTIERCLTPLAPYISYWVIVDTGSVDNTVEKVQALMDGFGIPGELHESEWVGFDHNRTESMKLSEGKCEYRLVMDADDLFVVEDESWLDQLKDYDSFHVKLQMGAIDYFRQLIFKSDREYKYEGKIHEFATPVGFEQKIGTLSGVFVKASTSGAKRAGSDQKRYENDAKRLLKEYRKDKTNPRTVFYLAQSCRDAGKTQEAIKYYRKRSTMGGWDEEVYYSFYEIARLSQILGSNGSDVIELYSKAWNYRPHRMEACFCLMQSFRLCDQHTSSLAIGLLAIEILKMGKHHSDALFLNRYAHDWLIYDETALAAIKSGNYALAESILKSLVESKTFKSIPEHDQNRIQNNLKIAQQCLV